MWCECLQHRRCIKISDNQYSALSDLPSNIVFFCMPCFHKLPSTIKAHDNVQELCSIIEKRFESIETILDNKLASLNNQITELSKMDHSKAIESQVDEIAKDVNANSTMLGSLKEQLKNLEAPVATIIDQNQTAFSDLTIKVDTIAKDVSATSTTLGSLKDRLENLEAPVTAMSIDDDTMTADPASPFVNNSVSSITVSVVDEQREREKRKLNLIFHNVAESTKLDGIARKNDDIDFIKALLHDHIGIDPTISTALRIGKKSSDKTRLLKVSVSSTQEKSSILSKCYKLRNSDNDNPSSIQNIFATPDLTPWNRRRTKL